MQVDAFREYLEAPDGGALSLLSARSYVSRLRRVERLLNTDLDGADLSPDGLAAMTNALAAYKGREYSTKSFADALTAIRSYAAFRQQPCTDVTHRM